MVEIALILARAQNGVIGREGDLPWQLSEDLKFFKRTTLGKPVVMGRKTFESIGKPLPGRTNIIITRDGSYECEGAIVTTSFEAALDAARADAEKTGAREIIIAGGGEIYREALSYAERVYLTEVHADVEGDVMFDISLTKDWQETQRSERQVDPKSELEFFWVTYERR